MGVDPNPLIDNVIAYWKLDESSGTVVDEMDNYNGTNVGCDRGVTGKIYSCFDFERDDSDYFYFSQLPLWSNFTINLWLNVESYGGVGNYAHVWCDRDGNDRAFIYQDGSFRLMINGVVTTFTGLSLGTGAWHMLTVVREGTDLRVYQDSSEVDSDTVSTDRHYIDNFGRKIDEGTDVPSYDGLMDEIGIWDAALDQDDIDTLWNSGDGKQYPFTEESPGPTASASMLSLRIDLENNAKRIKLLDDGKMEILQNYSDRTILKGG